MYLYVYTIVYNSIYYSGLHTLDIKLYVFIFRSNVYYYFKLLVDTSYK